MTKKHYEAIAQVIKLAPTQNIMDNHHYIAWQLANYFETDNKNFDRNRFLQACGIKHE